MRVGNSFEFRRLAAEVCQAAKLESWHKRVDQAAWKNFLVSSALADGFRRLPVRCAYQWLCGKVEWSKSPIGDKKYNVEAGEAESFDGEEDVLQAHVVDSAPPALSWRSRGD